MHSCNIHKYLEIQTTMLNNSMLTSAFSLFSFGSTFATDATVKGLAVSAIGTTNNASTLECWNLAAPPFTAAGASNYPIGDSTGNFVGVIPAYTRIGVTWARQVQFSIFLSGLVHVTLPNDESLEAYFQAGDIIIATDMMNVSATGHITDFPGSRDTMIAQFPLVGNVVPEHTVLHSGQCTKGDLVSPI